MTWWTTRRRWDGRLFRKTGAELWKDLFAILRREVREGRLRVIREEDRVHKNVNLDKSLRCSISLNEDKDVKYISQTSSVALISCRWPSKRLVHGANKPLVLSRRSVVESHHHVWQSIDFIPSTAPVNRRSARKRDLRSWDAVQSASCRRVGLYQWQIEHVEEWYWILYIIIIITIIIIIILYDNAMQ